MNIIELKKEIENKTLADTFLILQYKDNSFVARQYVNEISKFKQLNLIYTDFVEESNLNIFGSVDALYITNVDEFNENIQPDLLNNNVVICKTVSKSIKNKLKNYIVEIPKLEKWHLIEYATMKLSGLSSDKIEWLVETCKDINRVVNEIDKISIFNEQEQEKIFKILNEEENFGDLNSNTVFNLTNAVVKRDIREVRNVLRTIETIDAEPVGVAVILYNSFKNIINIQLDTNATAESLGISSKQFYAVKQYNVGYYSTEQLLDIFDIVTSVDFNLKSGKLPNDKIIDYLITRIM